LIICCRKCKAHYSSEDDFPRNDKDLIKTEEKFLELALKKYELE